jgi:hypothetical protein
MSHRSPEDHYFGKRQFILAISSICAALVSKSASATTDACWFTSDALKLRRIINVPVDIQEEFVAYLRSEIRGDLSISSVESREHLDLIFQNVESGVLAIMVSQSKLTHTFSVQVETCDFTKDWRPYWRYVEGKIKAFHPYITIKRCLFGCQMA